MSLNGRCLDLKIAVRETNSAKPAAKLDNLNRTIRRPAALELIHLKRAV